MASFFGSVATEVGGTVKELGQQKREERLVNEEEARRIQLEKMRMQNESKLLDKRIAADDKRARRTQEANLALQEMEQRYQTDRDAAKSQADYERTMLQEQSDMWQTAMSMYMQKSKTREMKGGGWTSKISREQVLDENGQMVSREYADITGPNGRPYVMSDGKIRQVDQAEAPHQFPSVDLQKRAEDDLMSGKLSPEAFQKEFRYLPADFVYGKMSATDQGFQKFLETENIRLPAMDRYMRMSGQPMAPGTSAEPTSNASASLHEIAKREGREPTVEETDAAVRQRRAEAGLPEYPEELNKFNTPYQGDFGEPGTSEWGEKVAASRRGGLLSQGQAATAPAPLETGGQLGPTKAAATGMPPMQAAAPGTELDDAGAAEVSKSIVQMLYQQSPFAQKVVESFKPGTGPKYTSAGSQQ